MIDLYFNFLGDLDHKEDLKTKIRDSLANYLVRYFYMSINYLFSFVFPYMCCHWPSVQIFGLMLIRKS